MEAAGGENSPPAAGGVLTAGEIPSDTPVVSPMLTRLLALPCAGVLVLAFAGCSSQRAASRTGGERVGVSERDFRISIGGVSGPTHLASGDLRLRVVNRGPDTHELLVVRARGSRLPLRADGLTVDEDAVKTSTVATIEGHPPGSAEQAHLHLAPGRYVLFCNMAGHYLAGMRTEVVVS